MPTPPAEMVQLLAAFAIAFTAPTFKNALVLVYGAILSPGRRTVTAALRAMGLSDEKHFTNYHRVLNRARWLPRRLSRILLHLLVTHCLAADAPLIIVVDEHLEERQGRQIRLKGWFRDPIRSTVKRVNYLLGIRWIVMALLAPVPWSRRLWALPFLAVPARSPKSAQRQGKRSWTVVQWTGHLIGWVRQWQPEREIVLVGDGTYSAISLIQRCQRLCQPVKLVSRLRLDANLYDDPPAQRPQGKRGADPKKGKPQPKLEARLHDEQTRWQTMTVRWYGGADKEVEFVTGVSLWHRRGLDPVKLRWVLVRCPHNSFKPEAFFCSDPSVTAAQVLTWFIGRWNIEVTFEEVQAHLGLGTQRHWSDRAMERLTPCLFGLFSLVVLMALRLHGENLPVRRSAWYEKSEATFSDVLTAVRFALLGLSNYDTSSAMHDLFLIPGPLLHSLVNLAAQTA